MTLIDGHTMALIKNFNAYNVDKLPFLMQILELFETGNK